MTPSRLRHVLRVAGLPAAAVLLTLLGLDLAAAPPPGGGPTAEPAVEEAARLVRRGRHVFRRDTFGSEAFWGDELRLHEALATVSPRDALGLGLKVSAADLPPAVQQALRQGRLDLDDPAVTAELLRLDAVVGVQGFFDEDDELASVGIRCSLCHSTVDDSLAPGVGRRLDGWPNRSLDVGSVIALAPDLDPFTELLGVDDETVRAVLRGWGPGRFDAALLLDGRATRPDGGNASTLIPPAYGLAGVNLHTYTGWGSVPHWNGLVAVLEMGGRGRFFDRRLDDASRFPLAAATGASDVRPEEDLVTPQLAALHLYQLSLAAPKPLPGSFAEEAASRGRELFEGKADCARCHVPPLFTEPGHNLHEPEEIGIDDFTASRSPTGKYRTTPLPGLWARSRGGYYHDGRFATLLEVVEHYDETFELELTDDERSDLVEYLKSL